MAASRKDGTAHLVTSTPNVATRDEGAGDAHLSGLSTAGAAPGLYKWTAVGSGEGQSRSETTRAPNCLRTQSRVGAGQQAELRCRCPGQRSGSEPSPLPRRSLAFGGGSCHHAGLSREAWPSPAIPWPILTESSQAASRWSRITVTHSPAHSVTECLFHLPVFKIFMITF